VTLLANASRVLLSGGELEAAAAHKISGGLFQACQQKSQVPRNSGKLTML
jgi:hypothetical protein